eukprot:gene30473-37693_t
MIDTSGIGSIMNSLGRLRYPYLTSLPLETRFDLEQMFVKMLLGGEGGGGRSSEKLVVNLLFGLSAMKVKHHNLTSPSHFTSALSHHSFLTKMSVMSALELANVMH